ncbi:MAG: peptidoglycan DD-metalloendopeptidase family protein [Bryobacteraceae bacterium]
MAAFTIDTSSPFPSGFTKQHGGPRSGGHKGPNWYIEFGMDLGANAGTEVRAVFDAHVTRFTPHVAANDTSKVFGAQLFMRSPNDMMGAFYTHITDVPAGMRIGSRIRRGDLLGKVHPGHGTPHLHLALVEIIGGAPHGRYMGVNLFSHFVSTANTTRVSVITFNQNGTAPTITP